ncbi:MAG TPA: hypothetical protein PLS63_12280 [Microthrixaceae bacterium]|nr:hypothetical protein [Microthrixaceae bacterium]
MTTRHETTRSSLDWFVAHPTMQVRRLVETPVESCRYDARHIYVETYWLPILGPSAVLAVRRIADWLDHDPAGVHVDLVDFGASLGVGTGTGRNTQVNRTLGRLIDFRLARIAGDHLEVRTELASVPDGLRRRLPLSLLDSLAEHERTTRAS